jgi:hypothetical protein
MKPTFDTTSAPRSAANARCPAAHRPWGALRLVALPLLLVLLLSLPVGQTAATAGKLPPASGPISAPLNTRATVLPGAADPAAAAAPVAYSLWARSSLGPLNLVVVSRSKGAQHAR